MKDDQNGISRREFVSIVLGTAAAAPLVPEVFTGSSAEAETSPPSVPSNLRLLTDAESSLTLSGPSWAEVGRDSETFTVTPGSPFRGKVSLHDGPSGLAWGTFSPADLSWSGTQEPKTFTYRCPKIGPREITLTNTGSFKNPAPLTFMGKMQTGATGPFNKGDNFEPADPSKYFTPDLGGYKFFHKGGPLSEYSRKIDGDRISRHDNAIMEVFRSGEISNGNIWAGSLFYPNDGANMPLTVVSNSQLKVPIRWDGDDANPGESDPGPYPIPPDARVQGYPSPGSPPAHTGSDGHVIVFNRDTEMLYEGYHAYNDPTQGWTASNGFIIDTANGGGGYRNPGHPLHCDPGMHRRRSVVNTAAGLPILPLSIRYDEVYVHQEINHAIGFTVQNIKIGPTCVWPARAMAWSNRRNLSGPWGPTFPYGTRLRLSEAWYNENVVNAPADAWGPGARVVLKAFKEYGLVLTDGGGFFQLWGISDSRWSTGQYLYSHYLADLVRVGEVPVGAFQVVDFEDDLLEMDVSPPVASVGVERTIRITYHGWERHAEEHPDSVTDPAYKTELIPFTLNPVTNATFTPARTYISRGNPTATFKYTPTAENESWAIETLPFGIPWPYHDGEFIIRTSGLFAGKPSATGITSTGLVLQAVFAGGATPYTVQFQRVETGSADCRGTQIPTMQWVDIGSPVTTQNSQASLPVSGLSSKTKYEFRARVFNPADNTWTSGQVLKVITA